MPYRLATGAIVNLKLEIFYKPTESFIVVIFMILPMQQIKTNHGVLKLPAFLPDATAGFVKGIDSNDLIQASVDGVVVNTYHLMQRTLVGTIKKAGGIHNYMNLNRPIISDSGGFQVMSLIHDKPNLGNIKGDEITFNLNNKKVILTPEKCIQIQLRLKSDIVMCLDDCTRSDASKECQKKSVERTIRWAKKCKEEFTRLTKGNHARPLLFAIVQGGNDKKLRKYCAAELLKIGFDGYSFGGWPVKDGKLLTGILEYTSRLIPDNYPKYAMGVGKPENIIDCVRLGYSLFDCVIPTRDARHKRLYVFKKNPAKLKNIDKSFTTMNIRNNHISSNKPISSFCDCYACKNYSLSYLSNLFKLNDSLAIRLATMHNLRFYSMLMELLR